MTKKDKTFDIQKWEIFLTNFEKSTLIGAIIVTLTGLIVYGHIIILEGAFLGLSAICC